MKYLAGLFFILTIFFILLGCTSEAATDYQAFMEASPDRVIYILNGQGETISGYDCDNGEIYNDLQTIGHNSTSRAVPADMMIRDDIIYVVLSGQNSVESYDARTLDYMDSCYLKNGFNPLSLIPVDGTDYAFVTGFIPDEVVLIDLGDMEVVSDFLKVFDEVDLSGDHTSEYALLPSTKNASGDNKRRGTTGGTVVLNGTDSRLYLTNVRYDSTILVTDPLFSDNLAEYNSSVVRANGYYRQGTMSVFSFDVTALTAGTPESTDLILTEEINLEPFYRDYAPSVGEYFPGDGLNPQSVIYEDGLLHIVCTGTNGGTTRQFTDDEYLPEIFSVGDDVPGTNPDDGVVIILDPSGYPDSPVYVNHLDIGGSPAAYRNSIDDMDKTVYLAGVGGINAYLYGADAGDFSILRGTANPVLEADNPGSDYYSCLLIDDTQEVLYSSFFSASKLLSQTVSGTAADPVYGEPEETQTGDGPGALGLWEK